LRLRERHRDLWNAEIDAIADADLGRGNLFLKLIVGLYAACLVVFLLFNFVFASSCTWSSPPSSAFTEPIRGRYCGGSGTRAMPAATASPCGT
jgi:hypothetical protein